jgi:two-component system response regulator HupR/HoxA
VALNCAAMPETLLESELFGHRRGAFTGAIRDHPGLFRAAAGGTIFLDEVGEMAPSMQAKLLRVLEEGEVISLGESVPSRVDVRVVSATNRDLRSDVHQGKFRSDLFYRLAVFPIKLPPLRDRLEDIPVLVQRFVKRAADRQQKFVAGFDETVLALFRSYDWPGNVRELQNEVERAVALGPAHGMLGLQHISGSIRDPATIKENNRPLSTTLSPTVADPASIESVSSCNGDTTFREARALFEARFIRETLARCDGNISRAAKLIGISRVQLQRKIKEYGIR